MGKEQTDFETEDDLAETIQMFNDDSSKRLMEASHHFQTVKIRLKQRTSWSNCAQMIVLNEAVTLSNSVSLDNFISELA